MITITVRQPHAAALVFGFKAELYRGYRLKPGIILIHAGQQVDLRARGPSTGRFDTPYDQKRGQIIGFAKLHAVRSERGRRGSGSVYRHIFETPMVFMQPVGAVGQVKPFDFDDEAIEPAIASAVTPKDAMNTLGPAARIDPYQVFGKRRRDGYVGD